MLEFIKKSRVLVFLIILYTVILCVTVTLNATDKKKSDSDTTVKEENRNETNNNEHEEVNVFDEFMGSVNTLKTDVKKYIDSNAIGNNVCIKLSDVYSDANIAGSVYVQNTIDESKIWYTNKTLYVSGEKFNNIQQGNVYYEFQTSNFDSCGINN